MLAIPASCVKDETNSVILTKQRRVDQPSSVVDSQDLDEILTKAINDSIIAEKNFTNSQLFPLRNNSARFWKILQPLYCCKDIQYKQTGEMGRVLRDKLCNCFKIVCSL